MELKTTNYPRIGVGVLVVRNEQFLLGKRIGEHMPGYYAAPGGHLEHGETFSQCATREIFEETGLNVTATRLLTLGNYMFENKHYVDIDMVVEVSSGEAQNREPLKCAGWQWYSADNLPSPLFIVTKRMITAYLNKDNNIEAIVDELIKQS
jgi:8-oxo-dGTP diphosphatase